MHETSRAYTVLLLVSVGGRVFGLPVTVAHDILKVRRAGRSGWTVNRPSPCPAPSGAPADVDGLPSALVDLGEHLGLPPSTAARTRTMIVIQSGDRWLGLLVDAVTGIVEAPRSSIEPAPASENHPAIRHHVRVGDRTIGLLDPEYLLPAESGPAAQAS